MDDPRTWWLNFTNIALGATVVIGLVVVAVAITLEAIEKRVRPPRRRLLSSLSHR